MRLRLFIALFLLPVLLGACSSTDTTVADERTAIEKFIVSKGYEGVDSLGGVYRYIINSDRPDRGQAPEVEKGKHVVLNYTLYTFLATATTGEGTLLYTNNPDLQEAAAEQGLNPAFWPQSSDTIVLGQTKLIAGLNLGLPGCRQGDTLQLFMSSDKAYGSHPFSTLGANTSLVWNLGIVEVY